MKNIIIYFLLIFFENSSDRLISKRSLEDEFSIYTEEDGIVPLNFKNIHSYLNLSTQPWIIVFYAHWCGHCVQFAKKFSAFAHEIKNWNIYIGAIDCASEKNDIVCADDFHVEYFPKILLFDCMRPKDNKTFVNLKDLTSDRNIHSLRQISASFIVNQTNCHLPIQKIMKFDMELWEKFKKRNTLYRVLIIIIGSPKHIGIVDSISLDLIGCNRFATAFIDFENIRERSLFGSFKEPVVVGVTCDSNITVLSRKIDDYGELRSIIYQNYVEQCPSLVTLNLLYRNSKTNSESSFEKETEKSNSQTFDEIDITDTMSGIRKTLKDEIPRVTFNKELINAIHNWVKVVYDCFPWPTPQKEFLHDAYQWMESEGDNLNNTKWRNFFSSEQSLKAFPYDSKWVVCKGSTPTYRGYPCSLWITFHSMSVFCENPGKAFNSTSFDVLVGIKSFITNFFGCGGCREHFREISKNVANEVHSSEEAIFWLWHRHNLVNQRIRLDDSADPMAPKVQYPTIEKCPECHDVESLKPEEIFISTPGYESPPIKWNQRKVLNFIRNHYGTGNIRIKSPDVASKNSDFYDPSIEFANILEGQ